MSDRKLPQLAKDLIAAKRLIENEEDWCPEGEGFFGLKVKEDGRVARCAMMAADHVDALRRRRLGIKGKGRGENACAIALINTAEKMGELSPIDVNNQGHAAVMRMFDLAIQGAINGE